MNFFRVIHRKIIICCYTEDTSLFNAMLRGNRIIHKTIHYLEL